MDLRICFEIAGRCIQWEAGPSNPESPRIKNNTWMRQTIGSIPPRQACSCFEVTSFFNVSNALFTLSRLKWAQVQATNSLHWLQNHQHLPHKPKRGKTPQCYRREGEHLVVEISTWKLLSAKTITIAAHKVHSVTMGFGEQLDSRRAQLLPLSINSVNVTPHPKCISLVLRPLGAMISGCQDF